MSVHDVHRIRFLQILGINIFVFLAELAVALYSGSLTMLSDSLHVSIHILAPFLAYISEFEFLGFSGPIIKKWTAGINVLLFFVLAGAIADEALKRLGNAPDLRIGWLFFVVAVLGLVANIYCAKLLYSIDDDECRENIKPLFWHMIFDGAGSVVLIVGAVIMYLTGLYVLDPILSLVLAILIVLGAVTMARDLLRGHSHNNH